MQKYSDELQKNIRPNKFASDLELLNYEENIPGNMQIHYKAHRR